MPRRDDRLDEELRFHLEQETAKHVRGGMTPQEARRVALLKLGGIGRTREASRDELPATWMIDLLRDLRIGARTLVRGFFQRKPFLAASTVLLLALGIGVNVAVFGLAWDLTYRPLPVSDPARLVRVWGQSKDGTSPRLGFSIPKREYFVAGQRAFTGLAVDAFAGLSYLENGEAVQLPARRVSANYFDVLGISLLQGRGFRQEEEEGGGVAVVTESFWRARLGAAPGVLGRRIMLDGTPYEVIGVAPNRIVADGIADIYITRPYEVGVPRLTLARGVSFMRMTARLAPGVGVKQANDDLARLAQGYAQAHRGNADVDWNVRAMDLRDDLTGTFRGAVLTLLAAAGLVLLLTCSNVGNLLTTHFLSRRNEWAIRAAIGGSRWRLLRQSMAETLILSGVGATLGLLLAVQTRTLFPRLAPNVPIQPPDGIPWLAFAVACAFGAVTAAITGALPVLHATRVKGTDVLRSSRGSHQGRQSFQELLVGIQVAVSLLLLVGATLVTSSFWRVSAQNPGFDPGDAAVAQITLPPSRYPDAAAQTALYRRIEEALQEAPGIRASALVSGLPLTGLVARAPYARADQPIAANQRPLAPTRSLAPGYFRAMGIPIVAGRDFSPQDIATSPQVVIVSVSAARMLFPDRDAVGQRLLTGLSTLVEIVGVAGDVRSLSLNEITPVELYRPLAQRPQQFVQVMATSDGSSERALVAVRAAVRSVDPQLPVTQTSTIDAIIANSLGQRRLLMALLGVFGVLAFVISTVGVYAVIAAAVRRRTVEIGVRMAVGASRRDVVRLVVFQGLRPVLAGLGIGLLGLPLVARLVAEHLYQTTPYDPVTVGSLVGAMLVVALVASVAPASRASRIDPVRALRAE